VIQIEYCPGIGLAMKTCSTYDRLIRETERASKHRTHIVHLIPSDIVPIEHPSLRSHHTEIKIVEQHTSGDIGVVWIHPHESCLERS
jgi:hypothetical protein